jgi:hypothetical protein
MAAIEAMREPTEAMIIAAAEPYALDVSDTILIWRAMIDAALKGSE